MSSQNTMNDRAARENEVRGSRHADKTVYVESAVEPSAGSAAGDGPTFADLGLSDEVLAAVADMGYTSPTPVQAASIPHALDGEDVLAAAQTGTGKTAAFLLPTMNNLPHVPRGRARGRVAAQGPLMLVVTPTRELAQQIEDVCRAIAKCTGHTSVTVVGGVSYNPQRDKLKRGCDILIATPGRLQDLIDQGACSLDQVQVLVLDEADRMLDMGFLPAVRRIVGYTRDDRQTLLFSATLDEQAVGSITDLVHDPARVEIAPVTSTADTVEQYVLPVSLEAKNALLASVLKREGASRAIVFCRTKHRADACSRRLARAGITCAAIHGDRSQAQRERALKAFRAGECDVLVATDVLARGIDISDVRYVVNFDVPEDPVDYIHRIGRTGRAGELGWSLTFVTPDDVAEFYDIEALMGKTADLFDAEGLEVGSNAPQVDPDRVPAKAPAGRKEKKRRRKTKNKAKGGASRGEGGSARGDGGSSRAKGGASRAEGSSGVSAANSTGSRANGPSGRFGAADGRVADGGASKPSRRKRGGKTRVRAEEGGEVELLSAREVKRMEANPELKGAKRSGGSRSAGKAGLANGRRRDEGSDGSRRSDRSGREGASRPGRAEGSRSGREGVFRSGRSSRPGRDGGARPAERGGRHDDVRGSSSRGGRDAWRNYDEPSDRRSRGGRSGRGGAGPRAGRDDRQAPRGGNPSRSTRRPGDRGGRR
ncbi:DEAD/DEAH box helicase [Collinsella stercoris]|nr:DEAD/DEAH box helicase [Collinsella stercoris]UEA46355.1 DEAD/DEAH box helicase [Collinsella stercoris DSM 13279]UWP11127.1 DEAD/DEAH box helicase [Collinsella stercoris]